MIQGLAYSNHMIMIISEIVVVYRAVTVNGNRCDSLIQKRCLHKCTGFSNAYEFDIILTTYASLVVWLPCC